MGDKEEVGPPLPQQGSMCVGRPLQSPPHQPQTTPSPTLWRHLDDFAYISEDA